LNLQKKVGDSRNSWKKMWGRCDHARERFRP
jgi:hypothetical protein